MEWAGSPHGPHLPILEIIEIGVEQIKYHPYYAHPRRPGGWHRQWKVGSLGMGKDDTWSPFINAGWYRKKEASK